MRAHICLVLPILVAACAAMPGPAPSGSVTLYKYAGSKQCAQGGGLSPAVAERDLRREYVSVSRAECGTDGRTYASSFGMPDGRIVIVEVPAAQVESTRRFGYKPLTELPEARPTPCPP